MKIFIAIALLSTVVKAHMEMSYPPPRNSKFNPFVAQADIDYNMVAPLLADGSNYPCKGYLPSTPVATFSPGQTIAVTMSGTVFHEGGHCQWSISYNDEDFVSIYTVMKDCFVGTGVDFNVVLPSDTPACDRCTFAWTWVNAVGNREYYMDCADITITGGSSNELVGQRAVIADLPGYSTIPEFPPATYDGSDLYTNAATITISPTQTGANVAAVQPLETSASITQTLAPSEVAASQPVETSVSIAPSSIVEVSSSPTTPSQSSPPSPTSSITDCAVDGESKCASLNSWYYCYKTSWFLLPCPKGTQCIQTGNLTICDVLVSDARS